MTLVRARVIKAQGSELDRRAASEPRDALGAPRARRLARELVEARTEAARIIAEAKRAADEAASSAAADAAREAREAEIARLAASFLALKEAEARLDAQARERVVELAVLLAERLLGEALRVEPTRIATLAAAALEQARGARRVHVDASPEDVAALQQALGESADVRPDPSLARGSLVVHTDLGRVDARLATQLDRLSAALHEALR